MAPVFRNVVPAVLMALSLFGTAAAQAPGDNWERALIAALGPLAEPQFANLRATAVQPNADNILAAALAALPPAFAWERHWIEGQVAAAGYDRASTQAAALASFAAAAAAATGPDAERRALAAQIAAAALIWPTDPAGARARLNAITTTRPEAVAAIAQLRGRMALAAGDTETALATFGTALAAAATSHDPSSIVLIAELTADLIMANGVAGRTDLAAAQLATGRDYHDAYTVAGEGVPACIPALGLTRETAVILRIERRGTASVAVEPVWSRGPLSLAALGHLRAAAASWSWSEDDVAASPVTRVYLSCQAGPGRVDVVDSRANLVGNLAVLDNWLQGQNINTAMLVPVPDGVQDQIELVQAAIARLEAAQGYDSPPLVLLHVVLAGIQSGNERALNLDRAVGIADRVSAPPAVKAALARMRWSGQMAVADRSAAIQAIAAALAGFPAGAVGNPDWLATAMRLMLMLEPTASADVSAANVARFMALTAQILALPTTLLPADDDLRRLTHALFIVEAQRNNDKAAVTRHLIGAGYIVESCALADVAGPVRGNLLADTDFPLSARKADIAGMVRAQRRVNPDGTTASARMVLARPPFLFDAPTLAAMQRGTQPPPRRAGKSFACDAYLSPVRWRLRD